jgi:hypothetical protein
MRWVISKKLCARGVLLGPLLPTSDTSVMTWPRARWSSIDDSRISTMQQQMGQMSHRGLRGVYVLGLHSFFGASCDVIVSWPVVGWFGLTSFECAQSMRL